MYVHKYMLKIHRLYEIQHRHTYIHNYIQIYTYDYIYIYLYSRTSEATLQRYTPQQRRSDTPIIALMMLNQPLVRSYLLGAWRVWGALKMSMVFTLPNIYIHSRYCVHMLGLFVWLIFFKFNGPSATRPCFPDLTPMLQPGTLQRHVQHSWYSWQEKNGFQWRQYMYIYVRICALVCSTNFNQI